MTRNFTKGVFCVLFLVFVSCKQTPDTPIIFEVISNTNELNIHIPKNLEIYRWKNHWVILSQKGDSANLHAALKKIYPSTNISIYSNPFYKFDLKTNCQKKYAQGYKRYIFTANLIEDSILQREYFEHHKLQKNNWPGVAAGFCNADFQQVLVYRDRSQLMLVIDIPKDKTLDEINPKTEENNPQMVEWNQKMSTYQVGIKDAPEGQTWVEFKKITD